MARKQHSSDAGYIAERMNPHFAGTKVVIYEAAEQQIETDDGERYAVICDVHSTIGSASSMPKARELMKAPQDFCLGCREAQAVYSA